MTIEILPGSITLASKAKANAAAPNMAAEITAPKQDVQKADGPQKKVFIKTFGCQMNDYDSNRMFDALHSSHNAVRTLDETDADIILLNTCSVREKAQEKVFHQLGRWKQLKQKNPDLVIGVGGCVASQEGADIGRRAPYVDLVFGPQTLHRLPDMLEQSHKILNVQNQSF